MDEQPEKTARHLIQRLEDSWNSADGEAFGRAFTEDADLARHRGDYHRSREAIAKGHHAIFNSIYKDSRVAYELLRARALSDGVDIARSRSV